MNLLNLPDSAPNPARTGAVLLPLVYDASSPGSDKAAEAIIQASQLLSQWDAETGVDLNNLGLQCLASLRLQGDAQTALEEVYRQSAGYFKKGQLVAAFGGNHITSLGLMRAAREEQQLSSVLHLAAHPHVDKGTADLLGESNCMAWVREKCTVVHAGIRSMSKAEHGSIHPDSLVFARNIHTSGLNAAADALDMLGEKIFLAIHLDVLDPAVMPAVSRPEPGGLDWYTLNALIRMATRERIICGLSITGLRPLAHGGLPAELLAAKLLCKVLISVLQKTC